MRLALGWVVLLAGACSSPSARAQRTIRDTAGATMVLDVGPCTWQREGVGGGIAPIDRFCHRMAAVDHSGNHMPGPTEIVPLLRSP